MSNTVFRKLAAVILLWSAAYNAQAQAGITASPTRLYFKPGARQEQKVTVSNPNKDKALEIGVALNDWNYDSLGNNISYDAGSIPTSCASHVKVLPGSYFTLAPGESKELSISVEGMAADKSIPVRTAMLYLTQLNPGDGTAKNGAAIKVTVRMGIKIYYTDLTDGKADMEITNFTTKKDGDKIGALKLYVDNTGTAWLNGTIHYDLLNKETGKKYQIPAQEFYSLPGDKRLFENALPEGIDKGKYTATAIVNFGDNEALKLAELEFNY